MPYRTPIGRAVITGTVVLVALGGVLGTLACSALDPGRAELLAAVVGTTAVQLVVQLLTLLRVEEGNAACPGQPGRPQLREEKDDGRK